MRAREFVAEISPERLERYLARADRHVSNRMDRMNQARQRLSKSYEIYHADRPAGSAQIVDRFEADTPEQARQYYEKFIQSYDSDVDFDLRLRKGTGIMEAFDAPYPLTWEHSQDSHDALARLPDGTNLSVMFSKEEMYDEVDWHVEFWRNNSQEVTGEGDQQRVFATVLAAIKEFIKKVKPERIRFSADKDAGTGRSNLYSNLVQRYANSWGYEVDTSEYGGSTVYNLYKLYEEVTEARLPRSVEDFLYSLTPEDVGVDDIGPWRIHYEGFTDDCQSSADYCKNPEAVYQQVFADHIRREGGRKPVEQNFAGDERYPILYSIFRI